MILIIDDAVAMLVNSRTKVVSLFELTVYKSGFSGIDLSKT
jgi:hypothetical protein